MFKKCSGFVCAGLLVTLMLSGCNKREERIAVNTAPQLQPGAKTETADQGLLATGYSLFHKACQTCHGNEGNGKGSRKGPSLQRSEYTYGRSREAVMESIRNGRPNGMPAVGHLYSQSDLEALTTYVLSLK